VPQTFVYFYTRIFSSFSKINQLSSFIVLIVAKNSYV